MFVDIHHHLIYGVDDGPSTFEQTQMMLEKASENGVSVICATSHAMAGIERFPLETYIEHLSLVQIWAEEHDLGIRICSGSEIFYTHQAVRLLREGKILPLNESSTVLVEFSPSNDYKTIQEAVRVIGNAGYSVVIAHAERYAGLRKIDNMISLREDLGAYIQINAGTILSPGGFFGRRWLNKVMENNCCDLVASDAHNTKERPCRMKACYESIAAQWGKDKADNLCIHTPSMLLNL